MTNEQLDRHLDAILRAAGSALKHYTMEKSRAGMRDALRAAISDETERCARVCENRAMHHTGPNVVTLEMNNIARAIRGERPIGWLTNPSTN